MVTKQVSRIEWVDIAKGIGIILMVLGHTGVDSHVLNFIYSFHMPMFFVLSGMLYNHNKYKSIFTILKARWLSLCIPYLAFTIVAFAGMYALGLVGWPELYEGWHGYALWFIPVLLLAELAYNRIHLLSSKYNKTSKGITFFILVLCLCTGYIISINKVHLYYKLEVVLFALFYLGIGHQFSDWLKRISAQFRWVLLMLILQIILSQHFGSLDMANNDYGDMPACIFVSLNGTILLFLSAKKISLIGGSNYIRQALTWAGRNTIIILGLSQVVYMIEKRMMTYISINAYLSFIVRQVVLWIILFLCSKLFAKYLPIIIGKR